MSEYVMGEAGKVSEKVTPMNPDELLNALATIEAFRGDGYRSGRNSLLPLVKELRGMLEDLIPLAASAMADANDDGAGYDIDGELAGPRDVLARVDKALEEEKR